MNQSNSPLIFQKKYESNLARALEWDCGNSPLIHYKITIPHTHHKRIYIDR
jgi:hypothetical protein